GTDDSILGGFVENMCIGARYKLGFVFTVD
ncbi:hypothetical protein A2U01_0116317, partial [Trifolium medium]|nr:hypothetical protein [Trifolium medium]